MTWDGFNPGDHQRLQLQCRWEPYSQFPHLWEPMLQTLRTCECGFRNYLSAVASTHLQMTSQGQPILGTSSLALEAAEVCRHPMTPPFDFRNFQLWLAASHWLCVRGWHLCKNASSRSLLLQHSVFYAAFLLWIPHRGSAEGSWPMDSIRNTTHSICCTQQIYLEFPCNQASFVSHLERAQKPSIRTHRDTSKMASSHARPHMESYQPLSGSDCSSWDRPPLRLQMPSISTKVRRGRVCIIDAAWGCGLPVRRLH